MSGLKRWDGTAEPVSRDQILRRERGQEEEKNIFPCSADHKQHSQPYTVDPYTAECADFTKISRAPFVYREDALLDTRKYGGVHVSPEITAVV